MLMLAACVLTAAAWLRSAEYDEQYTLLVTAGTPRPAWPLEVTTAGRIRAVASGVADPLTIAQELRATDVHPPLYFWAAAGWRAVISDSLPGLRMLSVCFAVTALGLVGVIARQAVIPPALAMLLTLGCYGFTYTGAIARGFALAELLTLAGFACAFGGTRRPGARGLASGLLLGAAAFSNYLACFVAVAGITGWALQRRAMATGMAAGFALWLPAIGWFYTGQRDSRTGQFPEFAWLPGLARLGRYAVANVLGGLPLYAEESVRPLVFAVMGGLALALGILVAVTWRRFGGRGNRILLFCAAGPALGLLGLAVAFHTTPIELRYLSFSTPFIGLLLAGAIASLPRRWGAAAGGTLLALQAIAITGLMVRAETMQPARAVAQAAAATNPELVLVPFGNDGVGVVGAFAQEAAPDLPLLIVRDLAAAESVLARVGPYRRVTLALLRQDDASRSTIALLAEILSYPPWRLTALTGTVAVYEHTCPAPEGESKNVAC